MRSKPWLKHTKAFLFYICDKHAKIFICVMNRGDENEPLT